MKSFKIVGFLVVVLFLGIFFRQEVLAESCITSGDCNSSEPYCIDNICSPCKDSCSSGSYCNETSKVCESFCKDQPGTIWKNGSCVIPNPGESISSGITPDESVSEKAPGDVRCWTKTDCVEYRKKNYDLNESEALIGFYSAEDHSDAKDACGTMRGGEVMGFCSPDTTAKTAIAFGTINTFENFGEFLRFIYQYGFLIAGVLAVFMIMVAGIQWLSSAGNQEKIGAAKKRIIGAVIGLLILSLSYTILNFINPYLVNFRLPQVWIINKSLVGIEFCHQIPDFKSKEKFKLVGNPSEELKEEKISSAYSTGGLSLSYNEKEFNCGNQYIYTSAPTSKSICRGSFCSGDSVCIAIPDKKGYSCQQGVLKGDIIPGDFLDRIVGDWDNNAVNDIDLYAVCDDGQRKIVSGGYNIFEDSSGNQGVYVVAVTTENIKKAMAECGKKNEDTAGFLLYPDFDKRTGNFSKFMGTDFDWIDEPHWLGKQPNNKPQNRSIAVDLGSKNTEFFNKLKNDVQISYDAQKYSAKDFLIPVEYFIGNERFQLDIEVSRVGNAE